MSSKLFSLIVSIPGQDPATHELSGDSVSLGRGPDNDIQVLVSEVSVKHAELKIDGDSVKIADVGSTNGTKVKGEAVGEAGVELSEKTKVLLGETIPAYFVSAADLEGSSAEDLIKSIDEAEESAGPKTEPVAPVAAAVPVSPAAPAATPVAPVKPGAAKPAAVAAPAAPAASGATTVKLSAVKPNNGPAQPGGVKPPAPAVPSPPKPAAPAAPAAPAVPTPAGGPAAPKPPAPAAPGGAKPVAPVPLKRPGAEGGPKPVPLPKTPPKP